MLDEIAHSDPTFIQEMLVAFVDNVTTEVGNIQSFKSLENWTAIGEAAHKLASNFAYMGASGLHALAVNIERSALIDHNLTGIEDKTDKMCIDGALLVEQLRNDFNIIYTG